MTPESPDRPLTYADRVLLAKACAVIALTAAACGACAPPGYYSSRAASAQHESSVVVLLACVAHTADGVDVRMYHGSGTIVGAHEVITANHMTSCPTQAGDADAPNALMAVSVDGEDRHAATPDVLLPSSDVARLHVDDPLDDGTNPVAIGPMPLVGDVVCEAAATPDWTRRCGIVQPTAKEGRDGDIRVDFKVEHGNSGSGLYDSEGRLVGVVVMLKFCEYQDVCQGYASSLWDRPWLVPGG